MITETGMYNIKSKKDIGSLWDSKIKVYIKYIIPDRLSVHFLSPTTFCWIGYNKWYLNEHFYGVFEVIEKLPDEDVTNKNN